MPNVVMLSVVAPSPHPVIFEQTNKFDKKTYFRAFFLPFPTPSIGARALKLFRRCNVVPRRGKLVRLSRSFYFRPGIMSLSKAGYLKIR